MNERVVSLTDRGRALEWLSLGFGLWLIGGLVFSLLVADAPHRLSIDGVMAPTRALALASSLVHLVAGASIAIGVAPLLRSGAWVWSIPALGALAVVVVERTLLDWLPLQTADRIWDPPILWGVGSFAELILVLSAVQLVRDVARREHRAVPMSLLLAIGGAQVARLFLVSTLRLEPDTLVFDPLQPWVRGALIATVSTVSSGLILLAIREASEVVRSQIWSGRLDAASPARAADWQRTAAGLDRFGAFLIAKLVIGTALSIPIAVLPLASALASAAMAAALLACRRVPDPPDARSGFTGAAAIIAACAIAELSALTSHGDPMLTGVVSWLGHLVAYVAVLRSIGRIGERLGDDRLIRRARTLGWMAVGGVGCAVPAGFLAVRGSGDLGAAIAAPMVVSAVVLGALLPCAILARELARTLRGRFAEPPRATARVS